MPRHKTTDEMLEQLIIYFYISISLLFVELINLIYNVACPAVAAISVLLLQHMLSDDQH